MEQLTFFDSILGKKEETDVFFCRDVFTRDDTGRRVLDKYYTPEKTVLQLRDILPFSIEGTILEPFCGIGNIIKCFQETNNNFVWTNDMDPMVETDFNLDLSESSSWDILGQLHPDWIITNPPYKNAGFYVRKSHEIVRKGAIFLLRLSFLEPCLDRANFLRKNPPNLLVITPRISFTGDGKTDSATTAFFVFLKDEELKSQINEPFLFLSKN